MTATFDEMLELAQRLGIRVRHVHLGGGGGGMARLKDGRQLFIDLDADPADQVAVVAIALAGEVDLQNLSIRPDVREVIDRYQVQR